jgi:hypothetical protein
MLRNNEQIQAIPGCSTINTNSKGGIQKSPEINSCPSRNGAFHPISALGIKFEPSKYLIYSSGSTLLPALNAGEIHHFRMDTNSIF